MAFLEAGACCFDYEEEAIEAFFLTLSAGLTSTCADLHKQVSWGLGVLKTRLEHTKTAAIRTRGWHDALRTNAKFSSPFVVVSTLSTPY